MHERYYRVLAITDTNAVSNSTIDIDNTWIKVNNNLSDFKTGFTDSEQIITGVTVRYKKIIPESDEYGDVRRAIWDASLGSLDTNVTTIPGFTSDYGLKLEKAFEQLDEKNEITINLDGVRDDATAELWLTNFIDWHHRTLSTLQIDFNYKALTLEIWNKVSITAAILPAYLLNKIWIVEGIQIQPNVAGLEPSVRVSFLQMPVDGDDSSCPADDCEIQKTFSTGTEIQKTFSTGTEIQKVFDCGDI